MICLGLDTTGAACSVSLVNEARVLAHESRDIGRGHAEVLAGMVANALAVAKLAPDQIDRIAVCTGPGGFTGLRVALSFAIGFAMPRGTPVVGIDALGLTYMMHIPGAVAYAVPYKDVRRDEVMFGTYAGPGPMFAGYPKTGSLEDAKAEADILQSDLLPVSEIDTRLLAWLAMDVDPAHYPPEPLYARGPDAKLPGGKSV